MTTAYIILIGTLVPTISYTFVGCAYLAQGSPWNSLVWFGYATANVGLMKISGVIL